MKDSYRPNEFAKLVGCTVQTLQNWDRQGKLIAHRNPANRRFYTKDQLDFILNNNSVSNGRKNIAYCRVSTRNQLSSLENQEEYIYNFSNAKGVIIDETYTDIGSGLNYNRPNWAKLLEEVENNQIENIYVTYKDRFVRFGFEWFESFCQKHGTQIVVLNQKNTSPQEELAEDLMNIVTVFSARNHGLRTYKKKIDTTIAESQK